MVKFSGKVLAKVAPKVAPKVGGAAAKVTTEQAAKDAAKVAEENAAKDAAKVAEENAAKGAAKGAATKGLTNAQKVALVAGGALTVAGLAQAKTNMDQSNSTVRTILTVKPSGDRVTLTYTPSLAIYAKDLITISGSNTTPSIDVTNTHALSNGEGSIDITLSGSLSSYGPGGTIKVQTNLTTNTEAVASDATSALTGTGTNLVSGSVQGVLDGLGLGSIFSGVSDTTMYIILAICVIMCMSSSVAAAVGMMPKH
jgi:hypothetical protein